MMVVRSIIKILYFSSDIKECDGENSCHEKADCTETPGSFKCACKFGFSGDGKSCLGRSIYIDLHID